jgi:hypothetical protein
MIGARNTVLAVHIAVTALALGGTARAESEDGRESRALTLFLQARAQMAMGHYEVACPMFADSQRLDPGAGIMLNLGYCYEKVGKPVSAWTMYRAAVAVARENGKVEWENAARAQAARVEASLLHVVISVQEPSDSPGLAIQLDGTLLPKSLWGQSTAVDPGQHEIRATASGRQPWSQTFEVDRDHTPTVTVPLLAPEPSADNSSSSSPAHPADFSRQGGVATRSRGTAVRTSALIIAGGGVVALALGGVLAASAKSTYDDAKSTNCAGAFCDRAGIQSQSQAFGEANIGSVAMVTGVAALVGAAVVWFSAAPPSRTVEVQPVVGPAGWGVTLRRAW